MCLLSGVVSPRELAPGPDRKSVFLPPRRHRTRSLGRSALYTAQVLRADISRLPSPRTRRNLCANCPVGRSWTVHSQSGTGSPEHQLQSIAPGHGTARRSLPFAPQGAPGAEVAEMTAERHSSLPRLPTATAQNFGPSEPTAMAVSKPAHDCEPAGCSEEASFPARTVQRSTSVAPFQLA